MNKKDYKVISEIIRRYIRGSVEPIDVRVLGITNDLADYFEREDKENLGNGILLPITPQFNREQFLKDCGINE